MTSAITAAPAPLSRDEAGVCSGRRWDSLGWVSVLLPDQAPNASNSSQDLSPEIAGRAPEATGGQERLVQAVSTAELPIRNCRDPPDDGGAPQCPSRQH
jgi:hypothetical protein